MDELQRRLNDIGGRGLEARQVIAIGVDLLAATTPINSFIGMFQGIKVYAYHDYPTNTWHVERA